MGSNQVKLGLVGAGRWGQNYIQTISTMDGVSLQRVATRNPDIQRIISPETLISDEWLELVDAKDIDGLILAVPPSVQIKIARTAIISGLPLLLEKPLALDLKSAEKISSLAKEKEVPVLIDHIYLFHPAYEKIKNQLNETASIKQIFSQGGSWGPFRADCSPLWDWAPHDLSMCFDLLDETPCAINGVHEREEKTKEGYGELVVISLEFPSGASAEMKIGNLMKSKTRRFQVKLDEGEYVFDNFSDRKLIYNCNNSVKEITFIDDFPLNRVISTFINGIAKNDNSGFGLDLAVEVCRTISEVERIVGHA